MAGEAEQQRLVAGAGDLEEDAALALQVDLAVVDRTGDARPPKVFDELVAWELDRRRGRRGSGPCACRVRVPAGAQSRWSHRRTSACQSRVWRMSFTRARNAAA